MSAISSITMPARIGANRSPDGTWEFLLWAPHAHSVGVRLVGSGKLLPMERLPHGYFTAAARLEAGTQYLYRLDDNRELPDPASRFQPQGVHGPSQLFDPAAFAWTDTHHNYLKKEFGRSVLYELHVGAYTAQGTFDALIRHLPDLADLGITTIELMPVAQFPGSRNWGYDGVYPFAVQNSYGGPEALQRFVNAAHGCGLSVALDVVYNHLGPEGNYLNAFGPYFTDRYRTPWGQAVNFDGQDSDEVRRFFIENARYWISDFHVDALRLDAVHGIFDFSARPFLAELKYAAAELSEELQRPITLIAESDLNDARLLRDGDHCGFAIDAQWSDDFHHSVHTLLTGEDKGYYSDFGTLTGLATTLKDGWYYSGKYSGFRKRHHGNSPAGLSPSKFVVCNQNHDQVGNRAAGERLTALADFERLKLAAGITLLSPFVPMLFMGEEYGETAPFQYFTSHGDPPLIEAVRRGRREEFAAFGWQGAVPDPQDEQTFLRSHLHEDLKQNEPHATLLRLYKLLIRLRQEFQLGSLDSYTVQELGDYELLLRYESGPRQLGVIFNFAEFPVTLAVPQLMGNWKVLVSSADPAWRGPAAQAVPEINVPAQQELRLSPHSFIAFEKPSSRSEAA